MTDAREIIARALASVWAFDSEGEATVVDMALTAAGFRIVGPDDLDEKTVEKCAAELEKPRKFIDGTEVVLPSGLACAAALRALKEKQG